MDHTRARSLAARALEAGGTLASPGVVRWDIAGSCEDPKHAEVAGRIPADFAAENPVQLETPQGQPVNLVIEMQVPCRKCPTCLRVRASLWRQRAFVECQRSARTWFGTLTVSPEEHYRAKLAAAVHSKKRGLGDFEALSEGDQFKARHAVISREITRYLKRVRKVSGAPLKYLLVAEAHKSGLPHYHLLVHEQDPLRPIGERQLRQKWQYGFSRWKLVRAASDLNGKAAAGYVTKYLTKSNLARVRASVRYGVDDVDERRSFIKTSETQCETTTQEKVNSESAFYD